ncbi:hypothetical protein Tco_1213916 [Tanacetum coccineum]
MCKDCTIFPREACSFQHILLVLNTLFKSVQRRREGSAAPRIPWKNLNGDTTEAFRARVVEGVSTQVEVLSTSDAESMESWWLCEEVQSKVAVKQARFRELLSITKARARRRRDLGDICFIKDEEGRSITDEEKIKKRWGEYFSSLLNTREPEGHKEVVDPNIRSQFDCYYSRINKAEVRISLQKMRRNKAIGMDQIPIEAWRNLGDKGIFWLTSLFDKIFTSAKMLEEWRLSDVIPIFKNKGDA